MKQILLRGSWQTRNIGDIAHTPGFLSLAEKHLPDAAVWLWPCCIDCGVREMLLENFPGLKIAESEAELQEAFEKCDLLINGSGPGVDLASMKKWHELTGKPYGFYGISADNLWSEKKRDVFNGASFIFCRDSLSQYFLYQQKLDCQVIDFGPDATFGLQLKKSGAAEKYLHENGLEPGKFVCVIPRLRYTPSDFDDGHFYYTDPKREAASMAKLGPDMEKMRRVIAEVVEKTGLKVLICPEMTYQVPMGRRYLYEPLPEKIKSRVVLKREYWITDEAQSVYAMAHSLISMEMHSPILFIGAGRPAILLRQAEDTFKGQMWRDIGLQKWILELNASGAKEIARTALEIADSYPAALQLAEKARQNAAQAAAAAFRIIGEGKWK
ncbi:MAG: polysaccharide pyruvyl transferase family protein [Lentisphaeria bacterium]|nr:polysaccharide pyruvyl transferase family protein [Lentisphaeria bacterium]